MTGHQRGNPSRIHLLDARGPFDTWTGCPCHAERTGSLRYLEGRILPRGEEQVNAAGQDERAAGAAEPLGAGVLALP